MNAIWPDMMLRAVALLLLLLTGLSLALAAFLAGMVVGLMVRVD